MKRLRITLAVAAACLSWASTATADSPPDGWGHAEYVVAQQYWNTVPSCELTISFDVPLEEGVIGQYEPDTCHIAIAHNEVLVQCQAVVHEYGHALNLEHSADEYSVMYPLVSRHNIPSLCVRLLDHFRPGQSTIAFKRL